MSVHRILASVKAAVVKPLAHCKCMGKFYSFLTSLSFHQPNKEVLKCICVDFRGLHNGINFILIYHCIGELLSISKVSSERELI